MTDKEQMASREVTINYYDGRSRVALIVDEEVEYPDGRLIVSYCDTKGTILHANQAFVDMSAYTKEELIGQPHNILRHPDVPKAVFADMWNTIQSGKTWYGYVKNLRKDGKYYWVYATVVPSFDKDGKIYAYTSIRRKPSREKVLETEASFT